MDSDSRQAQIAFWNDEYHLEYHGHQFASPYRSTVHLGEFVNEVLGSAAKLPCHALDAGCGAGANIHCLSRVLPNAIWTGVDIVEGLVAPGRRLTAEQGGGPPLRFLAGDFGRLPEYLPAHSFDVVFSIQTLSWLDNYAEYLPQLFSMVRPGGTGFITSLFTESLVDAKIQVTEYGEDGFSHGRAPVFYNVYCLDRFREACFKLGAGEILVRDFEIDAAVPRPAHRRMGTFTQTLEDGHRLQFSGPLLMPRKFVAVRMKGA